MSISLIFWILMLLWFVFALIWHWYPNTIAPYGPFGNTVLLFILFLLLGWAVFGQPIRG